MALSCFSTALTSGSQRKGTLMSEPTPCPGARKPLTGLHTLSESMRNSSSLHPNSAQGLCPPQTPTRPRTARLWGKSGPQGLGRSHHSWAGAAAQEGWKQPWGSGASQAPGSRIAVVFT